MREVVIPHDYYMGGHGDVIPMINRVEPLVLELHDDGTVTWRQDEQEH